jgi:hypothetical protein
MYIYVCVCVCVHTFLSEYTMIIPFNKINTFDFVMKIKCIFFKVGNVFSTIRTNAVYLHTLRTKYEEVN